MTPPFCEACGDDEQFGPCDICGLGQSDGGPVYLEECHDCNGRGVCPVGAGLFVLCVTCEGRCYLPHVCDEHG